LLKTALDDDENSSLYEASMHLLFSPWRHLQGLKGVHGTFAEVFHILKEGVSHETLERMDNLRQAYYECSWCLNLIDYEMSLLH
jgi:hypothetical protein